MHLMENEALRVRVAEKGAELQSLYALGRGREYLWQGDPAIWPRRAPLLFPIVGRLKDDAYTHAGKRYTLAKHGFAMEETFAAERESASAVRFALEDMAGAHEGYPFPFWLRVGYALHKNTLSILHTVENPGEDTLYFSIGAHPGFCCAMGDVLVFERAEALRPYRLGADMLLSDEPEPSCGMGRIEITPTLFSKDALIFLGLASQSVRLKRQDGGGDVHVRFGNAPALGIWAKPGAPYVCVEPWYGVDDNAHATGRLADKRLIRPLPPGGRFDFPLSITVDA